MRLTKALSLPALALGLLFSSCGDESADAEMAPDDGPQQAEPSATRELIAETKKFMNQITSVVKEVNEGLDTEKAIEQIEGYQDEANQLSEKMDEVIKNQFDGSKEAFTEKMKEISEGEMRQAMENYTQEMMKLGTSQSETSQEFMKKLEEVMSSLQ